MFQHVYQKLDMDNNATSSGSEDQVYTELSLSSADEERPGPSRTLPPLQNWLEKFVQIIDRCNISNNAKDWILSNIHQWDSLEPLANCEDLTRKQFYALENSLREDFLALLSERQAFVRFLSSHSIKLDQNPLSNLLYHFCRGAESLSRYVNSEDLDSQYSVDDCARIRTELNKIGSFDNNGEQIDADEHSYGAVLQEIKTFLTCQNLSSVAVGEFLQNAAKFDDLTVALESCEELSKREIKQLSTNLKQLFTKLKISQCNQHSQLKLIEHALESLSLPAEAVEWILRWLSSHDISNLKLDDLDQCEDLSKRQCKAVKEKLRDVYQVNEAKQTEARPACEVFLEQVELVLKNRSDIMKEASIWILENICSFRSIDDLKLNDDLSRRQLSYLKTSLKEDFDLFRLSEPLAVLRIESGSHSGAQKENEAPIEKVPTSSKQVNRENLKEENETFTIIDLISIGSRHSDETHQLSLSKMKFEKIFESLLQGYQPILSNFSKSFSCGSSTDFEELNKASIKTVALFGANEAVMQAIESVSSPGTVKAIGKQVQTKPLGLYLIDIKGLKQKFIICRSLEADFDLTSCSSRSTLSMLRLMCELTRNTLFCACPLAFEEKEVTRINRRASYAVIRQDLQHEGFKLSPLGIVSREVSTGVESKLTSTENGLLRTTFCQLLRYSKPKFEGGTADVHELEQLLQVSETIDLNRICDQFKVRHLETFHPEVYDSKLITKVRTLSWSALY